MKTLCSILLTACVFAGSTSPAFAQAVPLTAPKVKLESPAFAGAVFVAGSQKTARPMSDGKVFVSRATPDAPWIGPELTDRYGRFVFYGLDAGDYLLRIYDANGNRVWQQIIHVPGSVDRIVIKAVP